MSRGVPITAQFFNPKTLPNGLRRMVEPCRLHKTIFLLSEVLFLGLLHFAPFVDATSLDRALPRFR